MNIILVHTCMRTHMHAHSVICISFVGVAMTVDTTLYWTTNTNISISDQTIQLFPVDFTGSIVAVSYCSTSFVCQFNLLQLQKELKGSHTKPRLFTINLGAILGAYFLYNIVIFAGYFRVSHYCYFNFQSSSLLFAA